MTARSTDPSTWTVQEQADLVTAFRSLAEAFGALTDAVNAFEAARPTECGNCDLTTDIDPASGLCPTCLHTTEGTSS